MATKAIRAKKNPVSSEMVKEPAIAYAPSEIKLQVLITRDENGIYVARVPQLRGCITQGETKKELEKNIKEAIELYLYTELDESRLENIKYLANMEFIEAQEYEVNL